MNQQQRKERNGLILAGLGLVAFIALLFLLTRHLISEAPAPDRDGAWIAFYAASIGALGLGIPFILRLELDPNGSSNGGGVAFTSMGIALTINYVVDRLPIWVRGAVMGVCVGFLGAVFIGGIYHRIRPRQGAESSR